MPITWSGAGPGTPGHIDINVPPGRLGTVVVRCEGIFYKRVNVTFVGGGPVPPFPLETCVGGGTVSMNMDVRSTVPLIAGNYWVEVTHQPVPCPPAPGISPDLPFLHSTDITQMRWPTHPDAPEGKVFTFQLTPGEDVHVIVLIEPGTTGGGDDKKDKDKDKDG
jgi:hypothetical protein